MLHIIPILIVIIVAFLFFSYPQENIRGAKISRIIAVIAVTLCIYALVVFKNFWNVFSEYSINTDSLVLKKISAKVQTLLEQQRWCTEYLDYMDIYYQILYTKLKAESYVDLIDIQRKQSELILGVLNNLPENENNTELNNNLWQLFNKYYLSTYLCWRKSFRENADAGENALAEYYRVLKEVLPDVIPTSTIISQPFFFLYQRIAGDLTSRDARSIPHCRVASWQWYMNMLSETIFPIEILYPIDQQFLSVMSIIIQNGNQSVFRSFIANTMDGIWFIKNSTPSISDTDLESRMCYIEKLLPRTFSLSNVKNFNALITENTQNELLAQELQKYIQERYKYNHIRLVVIILGAYCLFKERYDYIKYILHYNQPQKGPTHFLNPDIIPDDINILLNLYADSYTYEHLFHHIWEDHNDGQYWFKYFIAILTCRLSNKKRARTRYDHNEEDNKQRLEYYESCIDEMCQHLSNFETITACGISEEQLDEAKKVLDVFSEDIQNTINQMVETQPLSDEKIKKFKAAVLEQISTNSIWISILAEESDRDNAITIKQTVGYDTLLEKSFLAESDTGIYIGFEHSLAEIIVYQIDFFIEQALRFRTSIDEQFSKSNFKDEIFKLDDSWVVLFINYYNMIDWLWANPDFLWSKPKPHSIGTTSKGVTIYSTGDPADRSARVFIFKRDCLSKIVGADEINIEVTDLANETIIMEKMIEENPYWLEKYDTEDAKRNFIRKNVKIKMSGEISFSIDRNPEVYVFDNI